MHEPIKSQFRRRPLRSRTSTWRNDSVLIRRAHLLKFTSPGRAPLFVRTRSGCCSTSRLIETKGIELFPWSGGNKIILLGAWPSGRDGRGLGVLEDDCRTRGLLFRAQHAAPIGARGRDAFVGALCVNRERKDVPLVKIYPRCLGMAAAARARASRRPYLYAHRRSGSE